MHMAPTGLATSFSARRKNKVKYSTKKARSMSSRPAKQSKARRSVNDIIKSLRDDLDESQPQQTAREEALRGFRAKFSDKENQLNSSDDATTKVRTLSGVRSWLLYF